MTIVIIYGRARALISLEGFGWRLDQDVSCAEEKQRGVCDLRGFITQ